MFISVLAGISVLFVLIFVGVFSKLKGIISDDLVGGLSKIVILITLPFLYFYTLATESSLELLKSAYVLPLFAIFFVLTSYLTGSIAAKLLKLEGHKKSTFIYLVSFTNCGFLAIPIAYALFGKVAVVEVVVFNIGFNVLYWTLGVWTLQTGKTHKHPVKNLVNSGTISLLLGLAVGVFCIKLPSAFLEASRLLGDITIPLAMLVVGAILGDWKKFKESSNFNVMASLVFCRLILAPISAMIILRFFDLDPITKSVIMLQATMPSASTTPMFTNRFGGDPNLASSGVFITTLVSVVTIPFFMSVPR